MTAPSANGREFSKMKRWTSFLAPPLLLTGLLTLTVATVAQAQDEEPAQPHPGFLAAKGHVSFNRYCASCHGIKADGTGNVAKFLKIPPSDLRKITQRAGGEFPKDKLLAVIDGREEVRGHGTREMPIWGEVFQSPLSEKTPSDEENGEARASRMITELIYYLETLQEPYEPESPTPTEDDG